MQLHLFAARGACSLSVHILLHEAGLRHDLTLLDLAKGQSRTPEQLKLNPKGQVPVLLVDGEPLTEVPAISRFIADIAPEKRLLPEGVMPRARAAEWLNWLSGTVHAHGYRLIRRPERYTEGDTAGVKAKGEALYRQYWQAIEGRLAGQEYCLPGGFSIVDAYAFVLYRWLRLLDPAFAESLPNSTGFAARMAARPAVAATLKAEE